MARHDDGEQARPRLADAPVRFDDRRLLARMGGGCDQHLTLADRLLHFGELGLVGRWRRHVELEIAGDAHDRHAEFRIALRIERRLREAHVELAENGGRGALERSPGLEQFFRHAAVDQQQRNARLGTRDDQVRPQIGFDENAEIGLPVRQEAIDETRRIERDELVQYVFRQPALGDLCGGHGAGSDQHPHMPLAQLADQRKYRGQFADACAMQPDQRTLGRVPAVDWPCRSPIRSSSSLPRRRRRFSQSEASGVAADMARR